jgi:hypothetical protein
VPGPNLVTTLIGAGNAAGLFPLITPGSTVAAPENASGLFPEVSPSPAPDGPPAAAARAGTAVLSARTTGLPVLTVQVLGLIALAFAVMLTITRLCVRRRGER